MKNKYLLSICIPTHNRGIYLKRCLDSLVRQKEFLEGLVEIVISDNASNDNTHDVVKCYQDKYTNIIYHKNPVDMKEVNFAVAMQLGNGILRKLGGDTRIYKKGSLRYFCDISREWKGKKPVIYFNNGDIRGKVREREEITTMDHFLECASFKLTWMDTFFLWEEECDDLVAFANRAGGVFWFVKKTLELMEYKKSVIFFNKRLIRYMAIKKKDVSYGIFEVFYNEFLGIGKSLVDNRIITQDCFDYLEKDLLFGFFMQSILEWELRHKYYIFSPKENLKETVWNQYSEKPYFKDFCKMYDKAYEREYFKQMGKNIPIIGPLLLKLKHMIEGW